MAITFQVSSITLNSNNTIELPSDGITIIVGPNNAGKSCLLKEIYEIISKGHQSTEKIRKIIKRLEIKKEGSSQEYKDFLHENTKESYNQSGIVLQALNVETNEESAINWWDNFNNGLHNTTNLHCTLISTLKRLEMVNPPNSINMLSQVPGHPIHVLYIDDNKEHKLSEYVKKAFGEDLILNRGAGSILPLHIGKKPNFSEKEDRVSHSYLKKLEQLPLVDEQGDGVKSFIGCLLSTTMLIRAITLLDEPEAFLHPPQARLLGSLLATEHLRNQLILATHSSDILKGILNTDPSNLSVLRVTRENNINIINKLDTADLKNVWSDPILRFSNILDGLFHEGVIICEADADCRFYSAVMDTDTIKKSPDVLFVSSGGKGRIPNIAKAFHKIKQKICAIVDFDLLENASQARQCYEALGGSWEDIERDYLNVKAIIEQSECAIDITVICQKIRTELSVIESNNLLTDQNRQNIKKELKPLSGWSKAKMEGLNMFNDKTQRDSVCTLLEKFKKVGLFLVPNGELESFDRTISGKSSSWVAQVLEKIATATSDLNDAKKFILEVIKSLKF